jgi:hypothetical protein
MNIPNYFKNQVLFSRFQDHSGHENLLRLGLRSLLPLLHTLSGQVLPPTGTNVMKRFRRKAVFPLAKF